MDRISITLYLIIQYAVSSELSLCMISYFRTAWVNKYKIC